MFGPSGDLTGSIREYWDALISRIENDARSLVTPPVPMTDKRRKLSISESGFVWSKIVESLFLLKNSEMVAINGLAFTKAAGVSTSSVFVRDIFSRIDFSSLIKPILNADSLTNSPICLTLRLLKWSISSVFP